MSGVNRYYVGLDVSLKKTAVCVIDQNGEITHEAMVDTEPEKIDEYLKSRDLEIESVGIEANNLAIWLYWKLREKQYPVICVETHKTAAFMSAQKMKTDRNDARGIAQMMRCGLYSAVHVKSDESQRIKLLLNNRRFLVKQRVDTENQVRGSLKTFGHKTGDVTQVKYNNVVRQLVAGDGELEAAIIPLLEQRTSGMERIDMLDKLLMRAAKNDHVCQLLMTAPGIGPLTSILYKSVIDDPTRFKRSKDVPCHLGLTPRKFASGEVDYNGGITKAGDSALRSHLYIAAGNILQSSSRHCEIKDWGRRLWKRSCYKNACVGVSRRLSIIMHRMWIDGTEFNWEAMEQNATLRKAA